METKEREYYEKYLNRRRKFTVDLGYRDQAGNIRPSFFSGLVTGVLLDRLQVFDDKLNDYVSLLFDQIIEDRPAEDRR